VIKLFNKLKARWGITSNWQILAIILVFSIAGPTVIYLRGLYFHFLGFDENTSMLTKTIAYLLFIFPAYQCLLLFYGFLLGQFKFFWKKEKALIRLIRGKSRKEQSASQD
jgi:hypothetical protein